MSCVRGSGWYEAQPEVLPQLSPQHKPDQQLPQPPLLPLPAGAPSPLAYFHLNSLTGSQYRAPDERRYFHLQNSSSSIIHTRAVIRPLFSFLLRTQDPPDPFVTGLLQRARKEDISSKRAGSLCEDANNKAGLDDPLLP